MAKSVFRCVTWLGSFCLMTAFVWSSSLRPWSMLVLVEALGIFLITIALGLRHWGNSRPASWLTLVGLLLTVGWGLGYLHGRNEISNFAGYEGQTILIHAQVNTVRPVRGGLACVLTVRSLSPDALNGLEPIRTNARVSWYIRRPSRRLADLQPGMWIVGRGVFTKPPLLDSAGKLIRQELAQAGILEEWTGRVIQIVPMSVSVYSKIRQLITQAQRRLGLSTSQQQDLLSSVVFGGTTPDNQTYQAFLSAGLLHVLAASGANVVLLTNCLNRTVYPIWKRVRLSFLLWCVLEGVFVWLFAGLCGFAPSIIRAAWMSTYRFAADGAGRRVSSVDSVFFALFMMAIFQPEVVNGTSAVLSFTATTAAVLPIRRQRRASSEPTRMVPRISRTVMSHLVEILFVTMRVDIALLPLCISMFHQMTPYAILSNLLAEPILSLLLPLAALFMVLAVLALYVVWLIPAAKVAGWAAFHVLSGLEWWIQLVSKWKGSLLQISGLSTTWMVVLTVAILSFPTL